MTPSWRPRCQRAILPASRNRRAPLGAVAPPRRGGIRMARKRIGVVLSGCGVRDGSEIQEAVLTLLALDRAGAEAVCLAPDKDQADVVDHRAGRATSDKRKVLAESARIARGKIRPGGDVRCTELR